MKQNQVTVLVVGSAILATLVLLAIPSGVSAQEEEREEYVGTGFLSDYSKLGPDPEGESDLIYMNPDISLQTVTGIIMEDLVFYFHPSDEGRTVDPERAAKMAELAIKFSETLRQALVDEGVKLVDDAGPGVARCRMAITNLGRTKTAARVLPQGRATGIGRGGAAMEAECVDSVSGEIVSEAVNSDKGRRKSGVTTWAGAESAIRKWAARKATRLEEAGSPAVDR